MFSVWAKLLRITDAKTYEQMRQLFHEKYHARIKLLVKLMSGEQLTREEQLDAGIEDEDAAAELAEEQENDDSWNDALCSYAKALDAELEQEAAAFHAAPAASPVAIASTSRHTPHVVRQEHSVNVQSWLHNMVLPSGKSALKAYPIKNLSNPYIFGVETDPKDGAVYLYNRHMAPQQQRVDVLEEASQGVVAKFIAKTGVYTARCLLFRAEDRAATLQSAPVLNPPEIIECEQLRATIDAYQKQSKLSPAERAEWDELLGNFERAQEELSRNCAKCAQLMKTINDIGAVSNKKDMSAAEATIEKQKLRARNQARTALSEHLQEPHASADKPLPDFLGKWVKRVEQQIHPSYIERGTQIPANYRTMGYHSHPSALCNDGRSAKDNPDNILFETDGRVDHSCMAEHGLPAFGQYVLARCANRKEPLGLGIIHHVLGVGETPKWTQTNPAGLRKNEFDAKYSAVTGAASTDADADAGNAIDEGDAADAEANETAAAACAASAAAADEAAPFRNVASAAAASEEPRPAAEKEMFQHTHRLDKGRSSANLRQLPNLIVEWFNHGRNHVSRLRLNDEAWWAQRFEQQAQADAAESANTQQQTKRKPLAPGWVVEQYRSIDFQRMDKAADRRYCFVEGSDLIMWKPLLGDFLTQAKKLRANVFGKAYFDLTERKAPATAAIRKSAVAEDSPPAGAPAMQQPARAAKSAKRCAAADIEQPLSPESDAESECSSPQRPSVPGKRSGQPPQKRQRKSPAPKARLVLTSEQ
jgi:hypothetical protein